MADSAHRKIIHIDMDAFYASVEQRDAPELRGKPVAVGGGYRGVVAAASYEARAFGVRSAMPSVTARRRCPELLFVKPRFEVYKAVSLQIRAIFADYTALIEPLALDEAYLDVSEDRRALGSARAIAEDIRARIRAETGLTASAGVSYCKFIAKLASDHNKPDGMCVIPPGKGAAFVATLPVKKFHGVGPVTAAKMERLGIHSGADLAAWSMAELEGHFGSAGGWYWRSARGIDGRPVMPNRPYKSVSAERTFDTDLTDPAALAAELERIAGLAWQRIARAGVSGRTVTLKVKFADFTLITRSRTLPGAVTDQTAFEAVGQELLARLSPVAKGIRLLGMGLHLLQNEDSTAPIQLGLEI